MLFTIIVFYECFIYSIAASLAEWSASLATIQDVACSIPATSTILKVRIKRVTKIENSMNYNNHMSEDIIYLIANIY